VVSIESSPLSLTVGVAALLLGMLYAAPWLISVLRSTSTPTGDTTDRVGGLCDGAGLRVRDVQTLDTENEETAYSLIRGPPKSHRLFVTSTPRGRSSERPSLMRSPSTPTCTPSSQHEGEFRIRSRSKSRSAIESVGFEQQAIDKSSQTTASLLKSAFTRSRFFEYN
jgi:hypothetical protein